MDQTLKNLKTDFVRLCIIFWYTLLSRMIFPSDLAISTSSMQLFITLACFYRISIQIHSLISKSRTPSNWHHCPLAFPTQSRLLMVTILPHTQRYRISRSLLHSADSTRSTLSLLHPNNSLVLLSLSPSLLHCLSCTIFSSFPELSPLFFLSFPSPFAFFDLCVVCCSVISLILSPSSSFLRSIPQIHGQTHSTYTQPSSSSSSSSTTQYHSRL